MMTGISRTRGSALLVNYAGYPSSPNSLMPDNGLASLAAQLRAAGHDVKILDYATVSTMRRLVPEFLHDRLQSTLATFESGSKAKQMLAFLELKALDAALGVVRRVEEKKIAREIAAEVENTGADLVGFKLWNGDGFSGPMRMAGYLKRRFPGLTVSAGGPQVKFFKDAIFGITRNFDALAIGDGEPMIVPLMEGALKHDLFDVPNIYYLKDGVPIFSGNAMVGNMDELPFPIYDRDVYPAMQGDEKVKLLVVEDRRGCENVCRFCVHPGISGTDPRSKTPGRIADEFESAIARYGISNFRLGGSSSPARLLYGIASEIEKRRMEVVWTAFARIKDSDPLKFEYLKRMGLFSLFFGIESGNRRVLEEMNKKVTPERIEEVIKAAREAGLFTVGSVIYPAPFDTPGSRAETFALLERAKPDSVPLQFMGIYPGTEYSRDPGKYNFEIVYPSWFSRALARIGLKKKAEYHDPEVTRYMIEYKINLLFPPRYWKPLPWKINGLGYKAFAAETQSFYDQLKGAGILTMLTDEEAMMAHLGGYAPGEFVEVAFRNGFTGNWRGMAEMAARVNCSKKP
ncbi:MAG TPA: radical SAM protein [Candidatus Omnitrophota bacterium]|nr:radical SAM protein [Candidatus Omnitrophota bacterium]